MDTPGNEKSDACRKYREVDLLSSSLSVSIENDLTGLMNGDPPGPEKFGRYESFAI